MRHDLWPRAAAPTSARLRAELAGAGEADKLNDFRAPRQRTRCGSAPRPGAAVPSKVLLPARGCARRRTAASRLKQAGALQRAVAQARFIAPSRRTLPKGMTDGTNLSPGSNSWTATSPCGTASVQNWLASRQAPTVADQGLERAPPMALPSGTLRPFVTGRTSSASSHTRRALRHTERSAEWQLSWGFEGRPVDWPGAETAENRSPEAFSLRTS